MESRGAGRPLPTHHTVRPTQARVGGCSGAFFTPLCGPPELPTAPQPWSGARSEGRACPHPLAHPWGQGEGRGTMSGARAVVVPAFTLQWSCLCGEGLLLCQVRQSLYAS